MQIGYVLVGNNQTINIHTMWTSVKSTGGEEERVRKKDGTFNGTKQMFLKFSALK